MNTRKFFKFLEYTFNRKQMPLEKMKRKETSNASVSSPDFVDPAIMVESEAKRLENKPIAEPSELYY